MYLNYKHIENEKQEILIDIAIEISGLWNTSKIDEYDLISFIDNSYDSFIEAWQQIEESETIPFSEFVQLWYDKKMKEKGIHYKCR